MKVHWTKNAIGHLANIYEYIGLNSPTYAKRIVDRIMDVPTIPSARCGQFLPDRISQSAYRQTL